MSFKSFVGTEKAFKLRRCTKGVGIGRRPSGPLKSKQNTGAEVSSTSCIHNNRLLMDGLTDVKRSFRIALFYLRLKKYSWRHTNDLLKKYIVPKRRHLIDLLKKWLVPKRQAFAKVFSVLPPSLSFERFLEAWKRVLIKKNGESPERVPHCAKISHLPKEVILARSIKGGRNVSYFFFFFRLWKFYGSIIAKMLRVLLP